MDVKQVQREIYQNKLDHNFNVTDIPLEFCLMQAEVSEAFTEWRSNNAEHLGEELADIAIYLLGLCEITGVDLEAEIRRKMAINRRRVYRRDEAGRLVKELTNESPDC